MVKKCSFCKQEGHYINECTNSEKDDIIKDLENKLYGSSDFKNTVKKFSKTEISLIAVKNHLTTNLSKANYISLFHDIYSNENIEDEENIKSELFDIFEKYNINEILNIYYTNEYYIEDKFKSLSSLFITNILLKKYNKIFDQKIDQLISVFLENTKEEKVNEIINYFDDKIKNIYLLDINKLLKNNFIKIFLDNLLNTQNYSNILILSNYHSITDFSNINDLKNNIKKIYTKKIFEHLQLNIFPKYEDKIDSINQKILNILDLNRFNENLNLKMKFILKNNNLFDEYYLKGNILTILNNESNINIFLLYKNVLYNDIVFFENINIIQIKLTKYYIKTALSNLQKIIFNNLKSDTNDVIIETIEKKIMNEYSFSHIDTMSIKINILNLDYIKNFVNNILMEETYFNLVLLYYHNTSNLFFKIDKADYLYTKTLDIYIDKIIAKIEEVMNSEYEENEIIEDIELKLINAFLIYHYIDILPYIHNDANISRVIFFLLNKIFFKSLLLNKKEIFLLTFKRVKNNNDYLDNNILKKGTLFRFYINYFKNILYNFHNCYNKTKDIDTNLINFKNLDLNYFDKNINKCLYFYYSLFILKEINIIPEILIDSLYIFKNESINNENIEISIKVFISFFLDRGYNFQYESQYHNQHIINEDSINIDLDNIDCPICLDNVTKNNIVITNCNHNLCKTCFNNQNINKKPYRDLVCCLCRGKITNISIES